MKIAILNYAGTVGKTTISAHLLSPRMNDAAVFAIETVNETAESYGVDVERIIGEKFRDLFNKLSLLDDAIIDIGASNIAAFLEGMSRFHNSHREFDYFIVPVTSDDKVIKETIRIVSVLSTLGIPATKIRLVFNRVKSDVLEEFGVVVNYAAATQTFIANTDAAIFENELFNMLSEKKIKISAALADQRDYRAEARAIGNDGDQKQKAHFIDMYAIKSLAQNVNANLDDVFAALFSEVTYE
jgi:CO dehydrogenase nickel-insertion accessory protein CooC1